MSDAGPVGSGMPTGLGPHRVRIGPPRPPRFGRFGSVPRPGIRVELVLGVALVLVVVALSFGGPLVWRLSPLTTHLSDALAPPSVAHPMGTDELGRDALARVMAAGQLDLLIALVVTVVGGSAGMALGLLSAISGGWAEESIMRVMDSLLAFPALILALAVSVALGAGGVAAGIGITISVVPHYARLMRSEVLRVNGLPFVEGAVLAGGGKARIAVRHVLPHTMGTMLVQASSSAVYVVLTLAALGFVGLGVQEPTAEWGTMMTSGLQYILSGGWWLSVFPGVVLVILTVGLGLTGDAFGNQRLDGRDRIGSAGLASE